MIIKNASHSEMKDMKKSSADESRNSKDFVYFNQNRFESDTKGNLKGSVFYVQNSVFPSHIHIHDDIQQGIVANRKLMILFQSHEDGLNKIKLNVKDERDQVLTTRIMSNNYSKIPVCLQSDLNEEIDFDLPNEFDIIIDENTQLNEISKDVSLFDEIILEHDVIKIETSDGHFARTFRLNDNQQFIGKEILFVCDSSYSFQVERADVDVVKLFSGEQALFVNVNGKWLTETEREDSLIRYMDNCWHASIPAEVVKPGIKFEFISDYKNGIVDDVDVGAQSQLLLHTISIGMLTPYLENFEFQKTAEYHRQYFQQIPVSQLIVSAYDPVYLKEAMMPDGRLLTNFAPDEGGVYTGSLREDIGKNLISDGINFANYGFVYSAAEDYKGMITGQIVVHTSVGKYKNGVQIHGLSGGAGKATLWNTIGNEFSHELGHNYGLGHYPGGFYRSVAQIPSGINSTWGWDSDYNFFIPNFESMITNRPTYLTEYPNETLSAPPFEGHSLGRDAMAGGEPLYPQVNIFTLHTPYTLSIIQKNLESKVIFNPNSETGFSLWDNQNKKMKPYELKNVNVDFINFKITNGVNITADEINVYLKNKNNVFIESGDGYHAKFVYLPDADNNNDGAIVKFKVNSTFSIKVEVNGAFETLHKGSMQSYISNGNEWEDFDSELLDVNIAPYKQGVNVITLVGFYDPENKLTSYIYPALNGAYGNVYHYSMKSRCYLEVECYSGEKLCYPLASLRINSNEMNKFHVNVERDLTPNVARIYIDDELVSERKIMLGSSELSYTINGSLLV